MGFGNSCFSAARIVIDGVTIIENIETGQIGTSGSESQQTITFLPNSNTFTSGSGAPPTTGNGGIDYIGGVSQTVLSAAELHGTVYAFKITASNSGTLQSIGINLYELSASCNVSVALYTDSAGAAGTLIAQSASTALTSVGWNDIVIPEGSAITAGKSYWIAIQVSSDSSYVTFNTNGIGEKSSHYSLSYGSFTASPTWTTPTNPNTPTIYARMTYLGSTNIAIKGSYYFRTDTPTLGSQQIYVYNGSAWASIGGGGSGYSPDGTTITLNGGNQLQINLENSNTWTGLQIFTSVIEINSVDSALTINSIENGTAWESVIQGDASAWGSSASFIQISAAANADNYLQLGNGNDFNFIITENNILDDGLGNLSTAKSISPGGYNTASHIWSGTGTPQGNLSGTAGDYYFRVDGSTNTHLYICTGTTNWTGIV